MHGSIVHIDTHVTWGGGQYQVLKLAEGLVRREVSTLVVAHEAGPLAQRAHESGLRVCRLPSHLASRWHPGGGRFLADACSADPVALIHSHDSRALTLAHRAARALRVPVVHARRVASPLARNPVTRFKYSPTRLAAVIATSRTVRERVVASGFPARQTFVVESGTDIAALATKLPDDSLRAWAGARPLIGSVGKLGAKKNWELLIEAAAVMAGRGHDLRWVVAGDGPEFSRLDDLVSARHLQDVVRLETAALDAERVVKALDVLFHPSRREGGSAIVRVAMLSHVPVVVADTPALVEALCGHGLVVGADNAGEAADAIERLLSCPDERDEMVRRAAATATRQYGIDRMVEETLDVYRVLGELGAR